eukprot:5813422-Amphidinium_carterae.1
MENPARRVSLSCARKALPSTKMSPCNGPSGPMRCTQGTRAGACTTRAKGKCAIAMASSNCGAIV